jgi:MFS family permease
LWIGQIISQVGTQMVYVAVPWQVWQLTRSTALVGLVGLAEVIPIIVFSLIGGVAADSVDRRALSIRMQSGMLICSAALAVLAFSAPRPPLWAVYALVAVASGFGAVDRPARSAMLPRLVAAEHMASAMALRQVVFQTTQIVGPALGGLLIAAFDVGWVYAFDALTFLAALASLRWVPSVLPEGGMERAGWAALREGVRFSFRSPLILAIFLVDLGAMIFGMPRAVFPALAENVFRIGPSGVGLLYAAPSVGALVAALSSGWVRRVDAQGRAVLIAVFGWGLAITGAGLSVFSLVLTLGFLACAGAADVISAVFRGTILVQATPDELLGRVNAANLMVVTGGPRLGDLEAGLAATLLGAPGSIVLGGLGCLVTTAAVGAFFPSLRSRTAPRA